MYINKIKNLSRRNKEELYLQLGKEKHRRSGDISYALYDLKNLNEEELCTHIKKFLDDLGDLDEDELCDDILKLEKEFKMNRALGAGKILILTILSIFITLGLVGLLWFGIKQIF